MAHSCYADSHVVRRKARQGLGRSQDEKLDSRGYETGLEYHLSSRETLNREAEMYTLQALARIIHEGS